MDIKAHDIGAEKNRVIVIDDFLDDPHSAVDAAAALAPYDPEKATYYPGLRRLITPADRAADAYVTEVLEKAAPFIGGGFDADSFDLTEASFSLVTHRPETLKPVQRLPHIDETDPHFLAVLHYLTPMEGTGTCFYRHRATGFERISPDREALFSATVAEESAQPLSRSGFIGESDALYEKILHIEGRFNRLLIYQGALLHSGFISENFAFSPDPRTGRLTGNLFVRTR